MFAQSRTCGASPQRFDAVLRRFVIFAPRHRRILGRQRRRRQLRSCCSILARCRALAPDLVAGIIDERLTLGSVNRPFGKTGLRPTSSAGVGDAVSVSMWPLPAYSLTEAATRFQRSVELRQLESYCLLSFDPRRVKEPFKAF